MNKTQEARLDKFLESLDSYHRTGKPNISISLNNLIEEFDELSFMRQHAREYMIRSLRKYSGLFATSIHDARVIRTLFQSHGRCGPDLTVPNIIAVLLKLDREFNDCYENDKHQALSRELVMKEAPDGYQPPGKLYFLFRKIEIRNEGTASIVGMTGRSHGNSLIHDLDSIEERIINDFKITGNEGINHRSISSLEIESELETCIINGLIYYLENGRHREELLELSLPLDEAVLCARNWTYSLENQG